jgi:hypothetical protein
VSLEVVKVLEWATTIATQYTEHGGGAYACGGAAPGDPIAVHGVGQGAVDQGRPYDRPHVDADGRARPGHTPSSSRPTQIAFYLRRVCGVRRPSMCSATRPVRSRRT